MLFDFQIDKQVPDDDIRAAVADLFSLGLDNVLVTRDEDGLITRTRGELVSVQVYPVLGDFTAGLAIGAQHEYAVENVEFEGEIDFATRLAQAFNCNCLADPNGSAPFEGLLVRADGSTRKVGYDWTTDEGLDRITLDAEYRHHLRSAA